MHKYRAAAKRSAWYDEDDEETNYNPFRKVHRRNKKNAGGDDGEDATRVNTNRSEGRLLQQSERDRRSNHVDENYGPAPHANTMPISGPSTALRNGYTQPVSKDMAHDGERNEKSQDSGSRTSDIAVDMFDTAVDSPTANLKNPERPRRRKLSVLQKVHLRKLDADTEAEPEREGESEVGALSEKRSPPFFSKDEKKYTIASQLRATFFNSWINVLLIFVPVGIAVKATGVSEVATFVVNFIAIIPLAGMLSFATEEIAERTGETIGGLLNASFGNAVELIVSVIALVKGEVDIVQESLIGSILSNLLLVMGMCFFFGGLSRIKQHFNLTVAQTASSLLALAVGSLIIPAAFQSWADGSQDLKDRQITKLSRGTAILLLVVYACYILFQLKTHASTYNAPSPKVEKRTKNKKVESGDAIKEIANAGANISATAGGTATQQTPVQDPEDESKGPSLSKWVALFTLAASTALVAICAEFMVDSIDAIAGTHEEGGPAKVSRTFVGLILLPIVGNAAEHATAVTVACKDKMDLAIGVAVGSSLQIALLLIPFVVVLGWILGNDKMNLAFDGFQIVVLFVSILLINYLIQDGESHWLEGVLLMTLYLIIAIAAWFYPEDDPKTINVR